MSLEHVRLSQQAREQLIRLKRTTGITNWNVLCRWSLCLSLADPSVPAPISIPADSSVEMIWKVFGGAHHDIYLALLRQRCKRDGLPLDDATVGTYFRLHLHRGIGYLFADRSIKDISALFGRVIKNARTPK